MFKHITQCIIGITGAKSINLYTGVFNIIIKMGYKDGSSLNLPALTYESLYVLFVIIFFSTIGLRTWKYLMTIITVRIKTKLR